LQHVGGEVRMIIIQVLKDTIQKIKGKNFTNLVLVKGYVTLYPYFTRPPIKARDARRITAAEMKYMKRTAG
jgi:hypothetical protein